MVPRQTGRLMVAVATVVAVLFTQQFLTVHELQHIGETDSSHCQYAPLASAAGGGVLSVVPALTPPAATVAAHLAPLVRGAEAPAPPQQARSPPRLA